MIEIWRDNYFRQLTPKGKLALLYVHDQHETDINLEDMALCTGIEYSECVSWIRQFVKFGKAQLVVNS